MAHPRARHWLVACGLVVGLALAAGTALLLTNSRRVAIADAGAALHNLSLVLAEEADRTFQATELVQLDLIQHLHEQDIDTVQKFDSELNSRLVNLDLSRRIATAPQILRLMLVDRFGDAINISDQFPAAPVNVRDRDYFRALTDDPARGIYISAPEMDHGTGIWSIVVASAYTSLDGRVLGIVTAAIQLASFEQFFAQISQQGSPAYALFRRDGVLLARFPRIDSQIGRSYASEPNFHRLIDLLDRGVLRQASMIDGQERLIAPHSVAQFPLFISSSNTVQAVLAGWRIQARSLIGATALIELVVAGIVAAGRAATARPGTAGRHPGGGHAAPKTSCNWRANASRTRRRCGAGRCNSMPR